MKKYNLRVDVVRFVLALLVVAIHTQPFYEINTDLAIFVNQYLGRLAVPLFFAMSGYYLNQKLKNTTNPDLVVQKTIFNLMKIYLMSWIIYIPLWFFLNRPINPIKFVADAFWGGMHYHLWYFPALIIGILIVYQLSKLNDKRIAWIITGLLYLVGMGLNAYFFSFFSEMPHIYLSRNGLFFAPIFVLIGFYPLSKPLNTALIISFVLYALEISGLHSIGALRDLSSMYVFIVPITILLLPIILNPLSKTYSNEVFHRLSLSIYIIHPVFTTLLNILIARTSLRLSATYMFVIVAILSIGTSWFYQKYRTSEIKSKM